MTDLYVGSREDVIDAVPGIEVINCADLTNGQFRLQWAQTRINGGPLLFLNPSEKMLFITATPKKNRHLGWDTDIPRAWTAWANKHELQIKRIAPLTTNSVERALTRGIKHLKFTDTAVEAISIALDPKSSGRLSRRAVNNLMSQLLLTYPQPRGLSSVDVAVVLGGEELRLAARIIDALGKPESISLAAKIPSDNDAIRLMVYIEKVIRYRNSPWLLILKTCRYGADNLRYEYKVGCILFIASVLKLCSYQTSQLGKKRSTSVVSTDLMLDLYQLSGIPSLGFGDVTTSF